MPTYDQIFKNNKKWLEEKKASNKEFFENLVKGQSPDFLYIGCSDSRVIVEDFMGVQEGEVFVHRNIANVVNYTDINVIKTPVVQRKYLESKYPMVYAWIFDISSGKLIDLNIDFQDKLKSNQEINYPGINK